MGKIIGIASGIVKHSLFSAINDYAKKIEKSEKKKYAKLMSEVDRNILDEIEERHMPKTYEMHQQYDSTIHDDFW